MLDDVRSIYIYIYILMNDVLAMLDVLYGNMISMIFA